MKLCVLCLSGNRFPTPLATGHSWQLGNLTSSALHATFQDHFCWQGLEALSEDWTTRGSAQAAVRRLNNSWLHFEEKILLPKPTCNMTTNDHPCSRKKHWSPFSLLWKHRLYRGGKLQIPWTSLQSYGFPLGPAIFPWSCQKATPEVKCVMSETLYEWDCWLTMPSIGG